MSWLNKQVSLYKNVNALDDPTGTPTTLRHVLFSAFGEAMSNIVRLRKLDRSDPWYEDKKNSIKKNLPCYTPGALLKTRETGKVVVLERTGLMQLDFDDDKIKNYSMEELKQAVFYSLPFVAYCGSSCRGVGFYTLVLIAEPERLGEYAEHCFEVFKEDYGIQVDTSKGRNPQDLRFISYDANPYWRENPEPLKIKHFRRKEEHKKSALYKPHTFKEKSNDAIVSHLLNEILAAQVGQRFATVQKVAYTAGGFLNPTTLYQIKETISLNPAFHGQENKYFKVADDCFRAGSQKPFTN